MADLDFSKGIKNVKVAAGKAKAVNLAYELGKRKVPVGREDNVK